LIVQVGNQKFGNQFFGGMHESFWATTNFFSTIGLMVVLDQTNEKLSGKS
jgi:hypothetical protein